MREWAKRDGTILMSRADGNIAEELVYSVLVLIFGEKQADLWRPRLPYIILVVIIVFVLALVGITLLIT